MERATLLSSGETITLEHIPSEKMGSPYAPQARSGRDERLSEPAPRPSSSSAETILSRAAGGDPSERQRIADALARCAGNQTKAAALLGISRRTLVTRLGDYGLPRPRK